MNSKKTKKAKNIRNAAIIAVVGNAILAVLKIIVGLLSQSGALLADGIDSSSDVLIGVMTLVVVKIIYKPADSKHPWGHGRAETVATITLSFLIFFMGGQLVISAVTKLVIGKAQIIPTALAYGITIISITGKLLLAWSQYYLGKRAESNMIIANAKNMASDVLISVGVFVGLSITALTGLTFIDATIELCIGAWVVKTAIEIFLEANLELMDGSNDAEPYQAILDAVKNIEGAVNPHRARMRRIAGFWDIDLDIEVEPHLTVREAHTIASRIEKQIKKRLDNVYDIMIHIEPHGDKGVETYGLSAKEMSLLTTKVDG